jgi:hypothetical protein
MGGQHYYLSLLDSLETLKAAFILLNAGAIITLYAYLPTIQLGRSYYKLR